MKRRSIILLTLISLFITFCSDNPSDDDTVGNWSKTSPFKGRPRAGAIVFTIGSKTYVGLGYDGDEYINDFYAYDINTGFWETKKSFPGGQRERAVAFAVNDNGYVGLGYNRELNNPELKDFWKYDVASDTWLQLSDFPGTARYNAVSFGIGSKGFVGTGYDGDKYNNDFWEYNPSSDAWQEIQSYPGEKIESGLSFVIGESGFICTGRNNDSYTLDFWQFNPEQRTWTKRAPNNKESYYDEFKAAVYRHDASAFVIEDKAYIVGGITSAGAADRTVYEFNNANSSWTKKTSFEGAARTTAVAFSLDGRGFVGTGQNGTRTYDDIWEFKPTEKYDDEY